MTKVTVSKYEDTSIGIEIENAGSLKLSREEAKRLLTQLENQLGVDQRYKYGTFVLHMPVQYMVENAKPKEVTVYNLLKEQLNKINQGETAAMILPALTDESGNRMFTLEYVGPQKI